MTTFAATSVLVEIFTEQDVALLHELADCAIQIGRPFSRTQLAQHRSTTKRLLPVHFCNIETSALAGAEKIMDATTEAPAAAITKESFGKLFILSSIKSRSELIVEGNLLNGG